MMYLGALHLSVTKHSLLSVMTVSYQGQDHISINDLHLLFNEMAGTMRTELWERATFLGVQGRGRTTTNIISINNILRYDRLIN